MRQLNKGLSSYRIYQKFLQYKRWAVMYIYLWKEGEDVEVDYLGENAGEPINKLSRYLEHSRDLNDLFVTFVDIDNMDVPEEVKRLIETKIQVCKDDKES